MAGETRQFGNAIPNFDPSRVDELTREEASALYRCLVQLGYGATPSPEPTRPMADQPLDGLRAVIAAMDRVPMADAIEMLDARRRAWLSDVGDQRIAQGMADDYQVVIDLLVALADHSHHLDLLARQLPALLAAREDAERLDWLLSRYTLMVTFASKDEGVRDHSVIDRADIDAYMANDCDYDAARRAGAAGESHG